MERAICRECGQAFEPDKGSEAVRPPEPAHICLKGGYRYDPAKGDPERGVAPGTPFAELPEDWRCPRCRAPKSRFAREA